MADCLFVGTVVGYFFIWLPMEYWRNNRHEKRGEALKYNEKKKKWEWVKL